MSEIHHLSPNVRRRLWQCYKLLLRLADEANKENIVVENEGQKDQKETQMDGRRHIALPEQEQSKPR